MTGSQHRPLRVVVLSGGDSAEREISLASGICVAAALEEGGHEVQSFDPAEVDLVDVDWRPVDACFIALHGGAGEDGRVQGLLQSLGVPYTGSGPEASRLAMSKSAGKKQFDALGVPTPRWVLLAADESIHALGERAARVGFPLVVKPDGQGSSLGVHLAGSPTEFQLAVADAQFYDRWLLAEAFVPGREFTVALIDREPLPLLEIVSADPLFTYQAKYRDRRTEYSFDHGLPFETALGLQQAAVAAAHSLGTAGLVRVDLRLDENAKPWVLEVNTVPGLTDASLAPRAAVRAGMDMGRLCDRLVRACLNRGAGSSTCLK